MRTLTDAEGRVIAVLLGSEATSERDRLRRIQVPRSTYHAARRRAYEEGWIRDRYVPDPARFGAPCAAIAVLRPFADQVGELGHRLDVDPTTVVAWVGGQSALVVSLHADAEAGAAALRNYSESGLVSSVNGVVAHVDRSEVPVYFDYEGLWAHLSEIAGAATYPTGLGGRAAAGPDGQIAFPTGHQRWAATELVHRPFQAEREGRAGHLIGPFGLPFSQQRMLKIGWVAYRVFLDPSRVPPFRGRSAEQIALVTGTLRPEVRPEQLFASLTRECRVYPFLYATDGRRVVLGALGRAPSAAATPASSESERRPVLATLQAGLQGIEVVQEPAGQLRIPVDHRYDRLLGRTGPRGGPAPVGAVGR